MRIKDLATRATKLLTGNAWFVVDNGTKVEKAAYSEVVKQGIEEYAGSTLAGSAQTVKSAIDALNSNFTVTNDALTKVKQDLTFGSQNIVYKYGKIVFVTVVFTTTSNAKQDDILFTTPYSIRFPVIASMRNDEGKTYLVGTDMENSSNIKALYSSGLPTGVYRGTFTYLSAL